MFMTQIHAAVSSDKFSKLKESDRERIYNCLIQVGPQRMSGLISEIALIQKEWKTCDALLTFELAIANRGKPPVTIDLT